MANNSKTVYLTQEGLDELKKELDNLINVNCKIGLDKSGSLLVYPIDDEN